MFKLYINCWIAFSALHRGGVCWPPEEMISTPIPVLSFTWKNSSCQPMGVYASSLRLSPPNAILHCVPSHSRSIQRSAKLIMSLAILPLVTGIKTLQPLGQETSQRSYGGWCQLEFLIFSNQVGCNPGESFSLIITTFVKQETGTFASKKCYIWHVLEESS